MSLPMNGFSDEELGLTPPKPVGLTDADLGIQSTPAVTNPGLPINLTDPNKSQLGNLLAGMTPTASPVPKVLSDAELGLAPQQQLPGYGGARKQSAQSLSPDAPTVGTVEAVGNSLVSSWYGGNKDEVYADLTRSMAVRADALQRLEELNSRPDWVTSRVNRGMRDPGDVPQTPADAMMENPAVERKALMKVVADMDARIPQLKAEYDRLHQIVDIDNSGRTLGYKKFQQAMEGKNWNDALSAFWGEEPGFFNHLGNVTSLSMQGAAESAWPSAKAAIVDIASALLPGGKVVQGAARVGGTFAQTGKDAAEGETAQQIAQWLQSKGIDASDSNAVQEYIKANPKEFLEAYQQAKSTGLRVGAAEGGVTALFGLAPGAETATTVVKKNPIARFFWEGAKHAGKEFLGEAAEEASVSAATQLARDGTISANQVIGSGAIGGGSGAASAGTMHLGGGIKDVAMSPFRKDQPQAQTTTPPPPAAGQTQAQPQPTQTTAPSGQAPTTPAPQANQANPAPQTQSQEQPQAQTQEQPKSAETQAAEAKVEEAEKTLAQAQADLKAADKAVQEAAEKFGPESQEFATASMEREAAANALADAQETRDRAGNMAAEQRAKDAAKPAPQTAPVAQEQTQPTQTTPQAQTQPQAQAEAPQEQNVEPAPKYPGDDAPLEQRNAWAKEFDAWKAKHGQTHWTSGNPKPADYREGTPEYQARIAREQAEKQAREAQTAKPQQPTQATPAPAAQPTQEAQPQAQATTQPTQPQATQTQPAQQTTSDVDGQIAKLERTLAGTKSPAKRKQIETQLAALKKTRDAQQQTAQAAPQQSVMPTDTAQQTQQTPQPEQKKGTLEQLELDIDDQIKGFKGGTNDVTSAAALMSLYAAKGAVKFAKGVRDKAAWTAEMIKDFGDEIKPHLENIWNRAKQLTDESKIRASIQDLLKPKVKLGDATKQEIGYDFSARNASAPEGVLNHANPEHQAVMASTIADEVEDQMKRTKADVEWYEKSILKSIEIANKIFNGALSDKNNEFIYKLMLALNSNGQAVMPNTEQAIKQTKLWLETGKFDTTSEFGGDAAPAINGALRLSQELIAKIGIEKFAEFLRKKQTVAEVNAFMKANGYPDFKVGGMNMGDQAVGSHIFGPKIGSFFANVDGNTDPVTMDTWFTRAMNRIAGTLTLPSVKAYPAQIQRILDEAKNAGVRIPKQVREDAKNALKLIRQMEKMTPEERSKINPYDIIKKDSALYQFAYQLFKAYEDNGYKKEGADRSSWTAKDKLNLASKALIENVQNFDEAPGSGSQRANFLNIIKQTSEILKARGLNMNNAAIQAVWWGREKMLWDHLGQRRALGKNEAFDLAAEAVYQQKFGKPSGVMDGKNEVAAFADTNGDQNTQSNTQANQQPNAQPGINSEIQEAIDYFSQMAGKAITTKQAVAYLKEKLKGKTLSKETQDAVDLLDQIAKSSKADFPFKFVLDKLRVVNQASGKSGTVGGFYHPRSGVIEISIPLLTLNRASNEPYARMAYIMAHEIVHSHTWDALQTDWMFRDKVKQLLKAVRTQMETLHGPDYMSQLPSDITYGLSNEAEFLAEGMTNREFQKLLASIQMLGGKSYEDEVRGLMQTKANNQNFSESTRKSYQRKISVFDALKSAVVATLAKIGIQVNKNTILEEIASLYSDAASKQTKNEPDKNSKPYFRDRIGFDTRSDTTYYDITGRPRHTVAPNIEEDEDKTGTSRREAPKDREHLRGMADDAIRDLIRNAEMDGEKVTVRDVLDTIANSDSEYSEVAQELLRGDKTSLDLEVTSNEDASGGHWMLNAKKDIYGPAADERVFIGTEQDVERSAIEEILHALTATKVPHDMREMFAKLRAAEDADTYVDEDVQEIVAKQYVREGNHEEWRKICEAWLALRKEVGPDKASTGYRTRDLFEFIPGLILDKDVGDVLSKLQSKFGKTWVKSFIDAIRRLFGFSKKSMESMFGTALESVGQLAFNNRTFTDEGRNEYAKDVFGQDYDESVDKKDADTNYVAGFGATDEEDRKARIAEYEDAVSKGTSIFETRAVKSFLEANGMTEADVQKLTLEEFVNANEKGKDKKEWHEGKPSAQRAAIIKLYNQRFKTGQAVAFVATHGTASSDHLRTRSFDNETLGESTGAPSAGEGHFLAGTQFTSGGYGSGSDTAPIRLDGRGGMTASQYKQKFDEVIAARRKELKDLVAFWHGLFPEKAKDRYPLHSSQNDISFSPEELIDSDTLPRDMHGQTIMGGVFDTQKFTGGRYSRISTKVDTNKSNAQRRQEMEMAQKIAAQVLASFPNENEVGQSGSPFQMVPGVREFYKDIADGQPYGQARDKWLQTIFKYMQEQLASSLKNSTPYNHASGVVYLDDATKEMLGIANLKYYQGRVEIKPWTKPGQFDAGDGKSMKLDFHPESHAVEAFIQANGMLANVRFNEGLMAIGSLSAFKDEAKPGGIADRRFDMPGRDNGGMQSRSLVVLKNPFVKDFKFAQYREESFFSLMEKAKAAGHDGVIFLNVMDANGDVFGVEHAMDNIYAVFPENTNQIAYLDDTADHKPAFRDKDQGGVFFSPNSPVTSNSQGEGWSKNDPEVGRKIMKYLRETTGRKTARGLLQAVVDAGGRKANLAKLLLAIGDKESLDTEARAHGHTGGHYVIDHKPYIDTNGRSDIIYVGDERIDLVEMAAMEEVIHALTTRKLLEETGFMGASNSSEYAEKDIHIASTGVFDKGFRDSLAKMFKNIEKDGTIDLSDNPSGKNFARSKEFYILAYAHYAAFNKLKQTNPELFKTKLERLGFTYTSVMAKDFTPDEFARMYRVKDFSEFVAGVLLDRQMQELLKGIKNPFSKPGSKISDFFRFVIDTVANSLGIKTDKSDSLYKAAIEATTKLAARDRLISATDKNDQVLPPYSGWRAIQRKVNSGDIQTDDAGNIKYSSTIDTPAKRKAILEKISKFQGDQAPGKPKVLGAYTYRGDMTLVVREGAYTPEFDNFVNDGKSSNRAGSELFHVTVFDKDGKEVGYAEGQRDFGLYGLHVTEEHREKGIATDILRAWARENDQTEESTSRYLPGPWTISYHDASPGLDEDNNIDGATSKALRKAVGTENVSSAANGGGAESEFKITKKVMEALDQWAKETLSPKRLNSMNPEIIAALVWQTAREMGKGIANFAAWAKKQAQQFGQFLNQADLRQIWGKAVQLARHPYDWATLRYFSVIGDKAWQLADRAEQDKNNRVGPNSSALRILASAVFSRPGPDALASGKDVGTLIKETRTKLGNFYSGILTRFADEFSRMKDHQLRDWDRNFIRAVRGQIPMPGGKLGQAVKEYRQLMKTLRLEMKAVGIDIGDQGDTYFPRIISPDAVAGRENEFIQAAVDAWKAYDTREGNPLKSDAEYEKLAQYWLDRIQTGADEEQVANIFADSKDSNSADFLKTRKFNEAEAALLDKFYSYDLDRITKRYIARASKLIEIARRFGAEGQVFKKLMAQLQQDNIPKEIRDEMAKYVRQSVGAGVERHSNRVATFLDWSNVLTALVFMGKAGLNNLVEGTSFGGRTLNPLDSLRGPVLTWYYLARQLGEVSPAKQQAIQRMKNKRVGLKKVLNQVIAEHLGLIHSEMERSFVNAHWDYMEDDEQGSQFAKWLINRAYKANLSNATEVAKRNASVALARLALRDNALFHQGQHKLQKLFGRFGFNTDAKESASVVFKENGVPAAFHDQFAQFVMSLDGLDDAQYVAKVFGSDPMAGYYRQAIGMMSNGMAIQSNRSTKPEFQDNAIGKQLLQLQNFNYSFGSVINNRAWSMVKESVNPAVKRAILDRIRFGVPAIVTAALSTAAFYGLKELYSLLFPSEGWDERKKKSDEEKALDALSYAGWLGPKFESVYKIVRRGQVPGGPTVTAVVEGAKTIGDYASKDTVSADRRMAKLGWNMGVKPVGVGVASAIGGPVGIAGTIAGNMSGPRDAFVDEVGGKKPDKGKGSSGGGGR